MQSVGIIICWLTIDFICGGFVASGVFRGYINALQTHRGTKLTDYAFRDKTNGWGQSHIRCSFEDGRTFLLNRGKDPYSMAFQRGDTVRENCFQCPYRGTNHTSDIIIGDYNGWRGIRDFPYDTAKGVSQIVINSQKGHRLFAFLKGKIQCEPRPISEAINGNKRYIHLRDRSATSKEFWKSYGKNHIDYFISELHLSNLFRLSVLLTYNYDSGQLTAVADCKMSMPEDILYAWYIFANGHRIETIWYEASNTISVPVSERGEYYIKGFVQDCDGNKLSANSNIIHID